MTDNNIRYESYVSERSVQKSDITVGVGQRLGSNKKKCKTLWMGTVEVPIDVTENRNVLPSSLYDPGDLVRDSDLSKATTMLVGSRVGVDEINLLLMVRVGNRGQVCCVELDQHLVAGREARPIGSWKIQT